ncbi:hypothetical protein D049_3918B, partial [Vibrio parahaemolyticus VPTS-2010]
WINQGPLALANAAINSKAKPFIIGFG